MLTGGSRVGANSVGAEVGATNAGRYTYIQAEFTGQTQQIGRGLNTKASEALTVESAIVTAGPRTVSYQRSDLSATLNRQEGYGEIHVAVDGNPVRVGKIYIEDGGPEFFLNKYVTINNEKIVLQQAGGGSLTEGALQETLSAYKLAYGAPAPSLSGSLAQSNLGGFKYQAQHWVN